MKVYGIYGSYPKKSTTYLIYYFTLTESGEKGKKEWKIKQGYFETASDCLLPFQPVHAV